MNSSEVMMLSLLERLHAKVFGPNVPPKPDCIRDPELAGELIRGLLESDKPVMIARFGSNELTCVGNYLGVKSQKRSWLKYIQGKALPWWWKPGGIANMAQNAGFFPPEVPAIEKFCDLMLKDIPLLDLLGSWVPMEKLFEQELGHSEKVNLELLNPYFSRVPWTTSLRDKKVLVIHPFAHSVEAQYRKRNVLFKNDLLPAFELKTIKAVQSIAGEKTSFTDWFSALESMQEQMDSVDYDICLIGCGAYGFPLAAHAKRQGKKGFHMGGSLQLLFGIRGKRWENPNYNPYYDFSRLMNEHWIKPGEVERPKAADKVENACYW